MMNPEMMKLAMEQMSRMTPEQRAAMMSSMPSNVSPDMMATAMEQMKHMKPDDWERARNEMSRMDPDTLARQAAAAQSQMAGRQQYVMSASNQLKTEGNQLHAQGRFEEAVAKYERARSNVEAFSGKEAADLARACTLNLSSCYLNLKQYDKCIEQCNTVLAADEHNLKALYRRGQARAGWAQWLDAAADLERALKLAKDTDQGQVAPIRDKLQEVKDRISALRASGQLPPASAAAPAPAPAPVAPTPTATTSSSSAPATAAAAAAAPSGRGPSQQDMARAAELIQKNPEMLKQAQTMMRGMSDEQLRAMARAAGVDDASVDLEALRRGDVQLGPEGLDPAIMAKVQQMQAELPPELRTPEAARDPESMRKMAELLSTKPELASTMKEVLSSMDPGQLAEMAKAAGLPAGMTLTPEMARMAADMMKNMSPEQVAQAMQQNAPIAAARAAAAAQASAPAAATAGAGTSSPSALADRGDTVGAGSSSSSGRGTAAGGVVPAIDPKQAAEMMAAMSPEQIEMMAKAMPGGDKMGMTPEMLKMAAEMMKNMSPGELAKMQEMAASMGMAGPGGMAARAGAAAAAGVPAVPPGGLSPEMAQMASEMMKNMTPEDLAKMQEMAAKMGMGPGAGAGAGAAGLPPGGMTPEMAQMAADMMKNMKPEDMVAMQEMAAKMGMGPGAGAGAAGLPPGGMTPEMAKVAADMMKNMKPEDIAAMQEMASKMGGMPGMGPGAGRPGAGGMPGMGDMGAMLKDPAMIENMIKMMKSMDPDAMANMLMSSGMVKDRAQAQAMARQMGSLTDAQLKMMVGATAKLQAAREWLVRNKLLVAALVVLAIALLLRWLGWM